MTTISRARQIRLERNLSLYQVEKATGIFATHLGRFENGKAGFSVKNLRKLTALYSATPVVRTAALNPIPLDAILERWPENGC